MKYSILSVLFFTFCYSGFAQFKKNEKLIGGNFFYGSYKDKNEDIPAGGTSSYGYTSSQTDIYVYPEVGYTVTKNLVVSVLGGIISEKYQNAPNYVAKRKGFALGAGVTKYLFFTKSFGMFFKLSGTHFSSALKYYYNDGTVNPPKEKYYSTNIDLTPGVFYRFTKHFSIQTMLAHVSYERDKRSRVDLPDSQVRDQWNAGFYTDVRLSAYFIF